MIVSKRKAEAISTGLLFISFGILFYFNYWWPGILLAIWVFIGSRQFLTERHFDFAITSLVLIGAFLLSVFQIDWNSIGPLLFILGGLYIIFKEYFFKFDDKNLRILKRSGKDFEDDKGDF